MALTVAITDDQPAGTTANIAGGDVVYTFKFSEAVTGFDASEIAVTNGSVVAATFSGSGDTYTVHVTPASGFEGNMKVSVAAGAAVDAAADGNTAASLDQAVDTLAPTVLISSIGGGGVVGGVDNTVSGQSGDNTVVGTAEAGSTVTLESGSTTLGTATADGSGNWSYALTSDNIDTIGQGSGKTITATATDAAGNTSGTTTSCPFRVDTVAPTLTITDDQPAGTTANIAGGDVVYTFQFSEGVDGSNFNADDVTVVNGTKGTFTEIDLATYQLSVTPDAGFEGNLTVDVGANATTDGAGNGNMAATQSVQAVDTLAPAAATVTPDRLIDGSEITKASFVVSGLDAGNTLSVKITDGVHTQTVTGITTDGTYHADLTGFNDSKDLISASLKVTATVTDSAGNTTAGIINGLMGLHQGPNGVVTVPVWNDWGKAELTANPSTWGSIGMLGNHGSLATFTATQIAGWQARSTTSIRATTCWR
jgi:Bacterial Ig-like domain/Bacterial Ig domain